MLPWFRAHWPTLLLALIILTAAALRFYDLGRADLITDEASINWRAIGYLDFLGTPYQTTPVEWLQTWPWWLSISFHDLPPLFFLLQHWIFSLFGVSVTVMRLLPALAGVASVIMVYVIGRRLAGQASGMAQASGLIASALIAINSYHLWISRIAMQESLVILWILLAFWCALRVREDKRWWYAFGMITGLAIMTKIHGIIIIPIVLTYYLWQQRSVWRTKELYLSWLIIAIIVSPYIVYNIMMYRTFGHFDYQFSSLFHQTVDAWKVRPGREEFSTFAAAFSYFFLNLREAVTPLFSSALLLAIAYPALCWRSLNDQQRQAIRWLGVALLWTFVLLMVIGPSRRFLTLMLPWIFLWLGVVLSAIRFRRFRWLFYSLGVVWIVYELIFAINTNVADLKWGSEGWGYSRLRYQVMPYGYRQLEASVDNLLAGKKPAVTLPIANANLRHVTEQRYAHLAGQSEPAMIIYDPRMYGEEVFWTLTRRLIYQGWPVLSYGVYQEAQAGNGPDFFHKLGITDYYFIDAHQATLQSPSFDESVAAADAFIQQLQSKAEVVQEIKDTSGRVVFTIYHWQTL